MLPIINQAIKHADRIAIVAKGKEYTYSELLDSAKSFAGFLLQGAEELYEARVGYMINPGFEYVKVQWATWMAGGVAVPLCLSYPLPSLQNLIDDTNASIIVVSPEYTQLLEDLCKERNIRLIILGNEQMYPEVRLPDIDVSRRAMILYTSGTTSKPKGVVTTHQNIEAQVVTLVDAWKWDKDDYILSILPLHHIHGIINVVACALFSGAVCEFLPYSVEGVFDSFLEKKQTVFMAVPSIYYKMINHWDTLHSVQQNAVMMGIKNFRLMVCGSAPLPVTIMDKWKKISGQTLLERYGMTEVGMALSNPYHGERKAGFVGKALQGVDIRLVDDNYNDVRPNEPGEILIKGPNVFLEYWNRPNATESSFIEGGWFKTGDIAIVENGYYRIMGRNSVDIIKSGLDKISALEIEEVLRTYPLINDCAVIGIQDDEWGELIAAAIETAEEKLDLQKLNKWIRQKLPAYKTPQRYLMIEKLPRNAVGKVTKNEVKKLFA